MAFTPEQQEEIKLIIKMTLEEINNRPSLCTAFSEQEIADLKCLVQTKKNAIRAVLIAVGSILLWVMKDIASYVMSHINFK